MNEDAMKHLKRIISYLLAMCMLILSPAATTAYNEGEDSSKSEETADYILNNLDEFSESYNSQVDQNDGEYFNPTNCEYRISVSILDSDKKAVYIDFNDDNGYMVVSEDKIVKLVPSGDLDYLRSFGGEIYYSMIDDKFGYYENNELFYFDDINKALSEIPANQKYAGTDDDGIITDFYEYVKDRYGVLTLTDCKVLDNTKLYYDNADNYFDQSQTILYTYYDNQKKAYQTEGNCVLVATHNALTYLRIKGVLKNFPVYNTFKVKINPTNDSFYEQAKRYGYISLGTISTSVLYYNIRKVAIDDYGYTVDNASLPDKSDNIKGITAENKTNFISKVANCFVQTLNSTVNNANMTEITSPIGKDYPSILCLYKDPVYGNHDVVVTGYAIYKKYTTILGIKTCTKTVNIIRIMNGWSKGISFYDVSASNSLGHVFRFDNK